MPANEMIKRSSEKHLRRQKNEKRKTIIAYQEHVNLKKTKTNKNRTKINWYQSFFFFLSRTE